MNTTRRLYNNVMCLIEIARELKRLNLGDEVSKEIITKPRIVLNIISQMQKSLLRHVAQQG